MNTTSCDFFIKTFNIEQNQHFDNLILKDRLGQHGLLRRVITENLHFYKLDDISVRIKSV